ncbi:Putative oxidoreductase [Tolypocladium paradoxum]|uniref:Oxidoreductase n=1 Tax=Tolypocladium paradoxum TaxID=94208 RepID=A0A2S4KPH2_9HYPO|nr:Putative oxidoreductase [Tolypocladium paradoxum]
MPITTASPLTMHVTASPSSTPQTLSGRIAIVSGSSSGIGLAIAKELASRGANVVINYPSDNLAAEAAAAAATLPTPSTAVCADLSTIDGPKALVAAAVKQFGRIDILVNNAAFAVNLPFEEQTLEHWDSLVNLNARGTFLLTQHALASLTHGSGRIVNICSVSSRGPPPLQTIYAGTKGMVDSFTRVWAKELPPKYGCTVNAVSPGPTATEGFLAAGEEAMRVLQPAIDATPAAKRMGKPDEVAYAVAFLCEERASWVNGEHMFVNGGLYVD